MSRGIVMETRKRYVIVMMPDGHFRKVPYKNQSIGEEVTVSEQFRLLSLGNCYRISFGAAVVILLFLIPFLLKGTFPDSSIVAYVTIDANLSIELGVNQEERVEELRDINEDGASVTTNLAFKGLPAQQVAEAIMDRIGAGPYIHNEQGEIIITSILVRNDQSSDNRASAYEIHLQELVSSAAGKVLAKKKKGTLPEVDTITVSVPKELRDEAIRKGISSGKLAFYLLAKSKGHQLSIEEVKKHSLHEIAEAWGGVETVIQVRKADDPSSEKVKQKQKELLKELLKQEK